jgi:hypothetical protein
VRRVVLEVRIEEVIPKTLSYEEARLVATARGGERRCLVELLTGVAG